MALRNPETGEYLKIVHILYDVVYSRLNIQFYLFRNREQRERFEAGLDRYEKYDFGQADFFCDISNEGSNDLKSNLFAFCYGKLKEGDFAGWEDC